MIPLNAAQKPVGCLLIFPRLFTMSSSSAPIDYASYVGIDSVAFAALFAAIYVPLAAFFIFRTIRNPVLPLFMMVFFCILRITGFGMRAYIASSASASQDKTLVIVESIVYGVGFLGVLNSVYHLQIDRQEASGRNNQNVPFHRISGNGHIVHLVLVGAVVLSIIGTIDINSTSTSSVSHGKTFRIAGAIIFAVVTGVLVLRCALHLREGASFDGQYKRQESIGERHGNHILLLISLVFLVRELYLVITVNNASAQRNEKLFYVLEAVPELIGICLLATPGLIPSKNQGELIPTYDQQDGLLMDRR